MPPIQLTRTEHNPLLTPIPEHPREARNASNAGAIVHEGVGQRQLRNLPADE
jgi:hypothetical protein